MELTFTSKEIHAMLNEIKNQNSKNCKIENISRQVWPYMDSLISFQQTIAIGRPKRAQIS